jgi:hypothetical protein
VQRLRAVLDFAIRLAFFAAAPFLLVFAAALFPITGALVQITLALAVFFVGEAVRDLAAKSRLARIVLGPQLAFEAFYREHPPRPFLYYVFYPVLFPYWLAVRPARREFLLYKGYTIVSFVVLMGSMGFQYYRNFPPELGPKQFAPIALGTLLAEAVVVLMFLMPITTTVVHFHLGHARRRLGALLLVGLVSMSFAVYRLERRRDSLVSYATRTRVDLRTVAKPHDADKALAAALGAAWAALPASKEDLDTDGKIEGHVLDVAHEALTGFYRPDEACAFDLWYTKKGKGAIMVVYFEGRRGHRPIWLAMDQTRTITHEATKLPKGAFAAMDRATQ